LAEIWVVNASPVILLAQVGMLPLLEKLPDELILPQAVAEEVLAGPQGDPARQAVAQGWATRHHVTHVPASVLEWGLGAGESHVITLAASMSQAVALLDDRLGRTAAQAHRLPVLGTVGVIVRARHAGLIDRAAEALGALQEAGLYLHPSVIDAALKLAGEK